MGNKCEICQTELLNGVCPNCNWVMIVFPKTVPQEISIFNNNRKTVAEKNIKENSELRKKISQLSEINATQKAGAEKNLKDNSELRKKISQLSEINATQKKDFDDNIKKLQAENEQLKIVLASKSDRAGLKDDRIKKLEAECQQALQDNEKLSKDLAEARSLKITYQTETSRLKKANDELTKKNKELQQFYDQKMKESYNATLNELLDKGTDTISRYHSVLNNSSKTSSKSSFSDKLEDIWFNIKLIIFMLGGAALLLYIFFKSLLAN